MKSLFIGGNADGRWIEHPDLQFIKLYVPPKVCALEYYPPGTLMECPTLETETYNRHYLRADGSDFIFYALKSMTGFQVFIKLFSNYRPVTETGNLK